MVINDITSAKKLKMLCVKVNCVLRSFINESSEGIVLIDENGFIEEWNKSAVNITGMPRKK